MKIDHPQLAKLLAASKGRAPARLDPESLDALMSSSLTAEEREVGLKQLIDSPESVDELSLLLSLESATDTFSEALSSADATPPSTRRPSPWLHLATAASIVLAVAVVWVAIEGLPSGPDTSHPFQMRGVESAITPPHRALLDRQPERLIWPTAGDKPTTVRLMDDEASTIWVSEPNEEGSIDLMSTELESGRTYFWQLEDGEGVVVSGPYWFRIQ